VDGAKIFYFADPTSLQVSTASPSFSALGYGGDMDEFSNDADDADAGIEILPPARDGSYDHQVVCLCCRKACSKSRMDDDGCGICEECLAT
jgi:hypothetical protein